MDGLLGDLPHAVGVGRRDPVLSILAGVDTACGGGMLDCRLPWLPDGGNRRVAVGWTARGEGIILKDIREFLSVSGAADAVSIARHVKADLSAVEGMLAFLEQRRQVTRCDEVVCARRCPGCKSGRLCKPVTVEPVVLWRLV
ncbi:MAG TPA: hypothetical protein DCS43_09935 [Verrucomicrobia bacterium]|nr:hypothetical protein [Verrucomicrobiota bacterium]